MITDPDGGPLIQPILRYVADPVAANGELVRVRLRGRTMANGLRVVEFKLPKDRE